METIVEALARHARGRPAAVALIDDRHRLAWREVKEWVDAAAGWLAGHGLRRGAPVLGWLPNSVEWYLLRLASERAGLFWIPVPASHGARELASIAKRARPAVLATRTHFRGRDCAAEADRICSEIGLDPLRITVSDDALLSLSGGTPPPEAVALRLDEAAHALPTSGTEGIPKLAVYSLRAACTRAHSQAALLRLTGDDRLVTLSPGVGPARAAWLAGAVAGACTIAMPVFGTEAAVETIGRARATIVCGTPAQLALLAPRLEQTDTSTVRIWYAAGAVLPPTLAEAFEARTRGIVVSTYGGADFGGWAAADLEDPPAVRHRTVGRPRGGTEFRIIDPDGSDSRAGEAGELIGRGPCCISGYLGEQGREQWREGWFHTGDLASLDAAGNVRIVGRLKELINRGGDNVSPAEVEGLLRAHPRVAQAAVVGIPDPILGERVCACVVPAPDGKIDLAELRDGLRAQGLASYKLPEQLLLLDHLPVVGDKIDRRALAAMAAK